MTDASQNLQIILGSLIAAESGSRSSPNICRPVVFGDVAQAGVPVIDRHIGVDQCNAVWEGREPSLKLKEIERSLALGFTSSECPI